MPPKKLKLRDDELFRMQLVNMIDMEHAPGMAALSPPMTRWRCSKY